MNNAAKVYAVYYTRNAARGWEKHSHSEIKAVAEEQAAVVQSWGDRYQTKIVYEAR